MELMRQSIYRMAVWLILSAAGPMCMAASGNPRVLMETNFGNILIELYSEQAPITVDNFLGYANSGFYEGLLFHRVIEDFMIQGGGYYINGLTIYQRIPGPPIINESANGLSNLRGTIAMARTAEPDSASSQFFINHVDNLFLDRANAADGVGYCVFGRVVRGMEVVDDIAQTTVYYVNSGMTHFPYNPTVDIIRVTLLPCGLSACSDLHADGRINLEDLAVMASQWMEGECDSLNGFCGAADLGYSGVVDAADLILFTDHWLGPVGSEPQAADLVEDGRIDINDLMALLSSWLDINCSPDNDFCDSADLNRSGIVNVADFALFASNWRIEY
jgi:cyclophilin family peptidyl-prolyl cis-trans isomerase